MLTSFVRAIMPEAHNFPSRRTTAKVLELVQTTDAGVKPIKIRFCSVYALGAAGARAEGVKPCTPPTLSYPAHSQRPHCADCGSPQTKAR